MRLPSVESLPRSLVAVRAEERAWLVWASIRQRPGWRLTSAHFERAWNLRLDGAKHRVTAAITAFLEEPRRPGFVFGIGIPADRPRRASPSEVEWFRGLQTRLGKHYSLDEDGAGRVRLTRAMRGITEPSIVLSELHHIAAGVSGEIAKRKRAREGLVKPVRQQRADVWAVLEGVRASEWHVSSIAHCLEGRVRSAGSRWRISASFIPMTESSEGHPGFAGMVYAQSRTEERLPRSGPIARACALLPPAGYELRHGVHFSRWHRGLGARAARLEIELLERVIATAVAK